MILELKKSFVKEADKIFNRLISGYYVDLQGAVDRIYYINSLTFCAPSATILCGDSSTLCALPVPPATLSPSCSFATGVARYIWEPAPGTTLPPVVFHCTFNGGYAERVENNCIFNGGYAVFSL